MCDGCEQQFGVYERYVSLLFGGGIQLGYETQGQLIVIRGVQYKALRMFQLSILWRASVSTLPFFSQVSLGPHEERIRTLLMNDDVGTPWQYGCLMYALLHEGNVQEDLIVQPTWTKVDDVFGYRFVFGGHLWLYFVASHQHPKRLETASSIPRGSCTSLKDVGSAHFLTDFGRTLAEQGKL